MSTSFFPTCFVDPCWRARELAFGARLRDVFRNQGAGLLLLLALIAVASAPASAQGQNSITCTLSLQGPNPPDPLTIIAVVNCVDSDGNDVTDITIHWGDKTSTSTSGPSVTVGHTYSGAGSHLIQVVANADDTGDSGGGEGYTYVPAVATAPPHVFAGQTSEVTVSMIGAPATQEVNFECTTVTDSNGAILQASALGIECSSNPPTITLTGGVQSVVIDIQTSGPAAQVARHPELFYALLIPLPLLIMRLNRHARRGVASRCAGLGLVATILLLSSCGGGFTAPVVLQQTPAGSYQVTVVDEPSGQQLPGFVQTSLIVPLTVNPVH